MIFKYRCQFILIEEGMNSNSYISDSKPSPEFNHILLPLLH